MLLGCVILVFAPYVFQGRFPMNGDFLNARFLPWSAMGPPPPHNPEVDDPILQYFPLKLQALRTWQSGDWPWWNPNELGGQPLLADGYALPLHPLNVLYLLLPPLHAWTLLLMLQMLLAMLGMRWFLGRHTGHESARLLGSVCFTLATCFATFILWPGWVGTFGFLPWLAGIVERVVERPSWRWTAAGGLLLGVQYWCASLQLSIYLMLALGLIAAVRLAQQRQGWPRGVGHVAAALGLGLGVGAAMLLPCYELFHAAHRLPLRYFNWTCPEALLTWLWRDVFGNPTVPGTFIPVTGYYVVAFSGYIGVWALVVACHARRKPERLPYLMLAAGGPLYVLLSDFWPLRRLIASLVPGYFAQDHLRTVGVAVFGLAALAAFGLSDVMDDAERASRLVRNTLWTLLGAAAVVVVGERLIGGDRILAQAVRQLRAAHGTVLFTPYVWTPLALLGVLAGWTHLTGQSRPRLWAIGVLVVTILDLAPAAQAWPPFVPQNQVYAETPALVWLQEHNDGRILVVEPPGAFRGVTGMLPPDTPSVYGLADARGYESVFIQSYRELIGAGERDWFNSFAAPDSPVVDLLGVRHLMALSSRAGGPAETTRWKRVYDGEVAIFENQRPAPRAFVVSRWQVLPRDALLERIHRATGDLHETCLLEKAPSIGEGEGAWHAASIVRQSANEVDVSCQGAGLLVLADTWFPGWTATVDGQPAEVLRAYGALRAVAVGAGTHTVVFRYRPASIRWGFALTGAALLGCLVLLVRRA